MARRVEDEAEERREGRVVGAAEYRKRRKGQTARPMMQWLASLTRMRSAGVGAGAAGVDVRAGAVDEEVLQGEERQRTLEDQQVDQVQRRQRHMQLHERV